MNLVVDLKKDPRNLYSCLFYMEVELCLLIDYLSLACSVYLYLEDLFQRKLPR